MWVDEQPRRHGWATPWSKDQIGAALTLTYVGSTFLCLVLPALRRCASLVKHSMAVSPNAIDSFWVAWLHRGTAILASLAASSYLVLMYRDPSQENTEYEPWGSVSSTASITTAESQPVCAHCNFMLQQCPRDDEATGRDTNGQHGLAQMEDREEVALTCPACHSEVEAVGSGMVGSWLYGLHGAHRFEIVRNMDSSLHFVEDAFDARLYMQSSDDLGGPLCFIAELPKGGSLRLLEVGRHVLRVDRRDEDGLSWGAPLFAFRRAGYGARGRWVLPAWWEEDEQQHLSPISDASPSTSSCSPPETAMGSPDVETPMEAAAKPWIQFRVTAPASSVVAGPKINDGHDCCKPCQHRIIMSKKRGPDPVRNVTHDCEEEAIGTLHRRTDDERFNFEAALAWPDGRSAGMVRLRTELNSLICQFKAGQSATEVWGPEVAALRAGVVLCERCGLLSLPPSAARPHVMKHCDWCNKCVPGFDHHCRFIGQCVGHANYRTWLLFVTSLHGLGLMTSLLSGFALYGVITSARYSFALKPISRTITALALLPTLAMDSFVTAWLGGLLAFHGYFSFKGRTTMEAVLEVTSEEIFERRRRRYFDRVYSIVSEHLIPAWQNEPEQLPHVDAVDEHASAAEEATRENFKALTLLLPNEESGVFDIGETEEPVSPLRRAANAVISSFSLWSPSKAVNAVTSPPPNRSWAETLLSPSRLCQSERPSSFTFSIERSSKHDLPLRLKSRAALFGAELTQEDLSLVRSIRHRSRAQGAKRSSALRRGRSEPASSTDGCRRRLHRVWDDDKNEDAGNSELAGDASVEHL